MTKKERAAAVAEELARLYPESECALEYGGEGWKLLIMGRLSAQCTDARVNIVCRELFSVYPTAKALADAPIEDIERIIKPCGLYRTKAKSAKESMQKLVYEYDDVIPDDMDTLLTFPGVGRKIANLLLGDLYKKGGIVADTHCIRICGRLGFYSEDKKDPLHTERVMEKLIPAEEQSDFCNRIVMFGSNYCMARGPRCDECPIRAYCKKVS